ncbi:class I SAM-dependent methyltransferase (plasmid) [Sinorhizobium numidicum]|uniref:Class I SAM-dependent methyltransferase n=1 Tax=Sinorhizobium numidicum TaxID=680248 RepID=A0ABY8D861_9HYPH|nr:class I SAM-dependent methyltransferase [Sinorhizobium numidicum]WEX79328.1 class I SAM-dependent methyltransferase [Sinorhizobium numidicum]WEX85301.1 class I SAM-dependent methyltransferase [Sinorhizobium numidicum]
METTLEIETRAVFDRHQRQQENDEHIFTRLVSLVDEEYFGFDPGGFKGLSILDAGCGSNANASFAFLEKGAAKVTSLELGQEWMDCAARRLSSFGMRSALVGGSVLDLPFDDRDFDLVHCAGVLPHTADPRRGFDELARVTRPSGHFFLTIMGTGNGVLYRCINHLRALYTSDAGFRRTIDDLDGRTAKEALNWLLAVKNQNECPLLEGEDDFVRSLFDDDLFVTLRDRLQAPTYHEFDFTEEQIRSWFAENGFSDVRRISRYTKGFHNLRRYLAPMYLNYDHPVARFWFGDGCIQMIGRKV